VAASDLRPPEILWQGHNKSSLTKASTLTNQPRRLMDANWYSIAFLVVVIAIIVIVILLNMGNQNQLNFNDIGLAPVWVRALGIPLALLLIYLRTLINRFRDSRRHE
jgi:protein-S-isoprenylcysteine O-methyltransferase Ste14